ncbi:S-layer family protein [Paenibacillus cellulosilyticus]|uniref:S-layer family protein n=1 Tax=Paenibacillus cellulosilyticus TaxID=375489 RepID=A0A2V2YW55_9BACL|nr:S-layer homology domain-containing protein [Paenibacillus cellulosilyticus]PWW05201.1 S-layer family protein [Paenibacillus cellulosilyticus]QKS43525.1 S-layer homology domain-containing protein [Paenibacillus cellulosilyticus]
MKKKYSKLLLLSLGASLLLPGAITNAATKTSADFTDLAGLDAATKAKFDALLNAGVFEGNGTSQFGVDEEMNRAQFAKVAALIYGLEINKNITTSSFSDVGGDSGTNAWAIPYIEAAKKAGLINGRTDGTFDPSSNVNMAEFATVLLRGLGAQLDQTSTPWYADAIRQAISVKLLPDGSDPKQLATRGDLVVGAYNVVENIDELKKKLQEQNNNNNNNENNNNENNNGSEEPGDTDTPSTGGTIRPSYPSDKTAPTITAATINNRSVKVTDGTTGIISFKSSEYLTSGTLSVSEASTLSITSIEGISLSDYTSLSFTQSLSAGSNSLNLIKTLGALDPQEDGVSMSLLNQLDSNQDGLLIEGTLRDAAGNTSAIQLKIKADDIAPSLTAATINGSSVTLSDNYGSFGLLPNDYLRTGTITSNEDATFTVTEIEGIVLSQYSFNFSQEVKEDTAASLDLVSFLGSSDRQNNGLSYSYLKLLSGASDSLTLTGTLTDAAGNSSTVTLTINFLQYG